MAFSIIVEVIDGSLAKTTEQTLSLQNVHYKNLEFESSSL